MTAAAYLDHIALEQDARALRNAAIRKMCAAGVARLRAMLAPRPVAHAA